MINLKKVPAVVKENIITESQLSMLEGILYNHLYNYSYNKNIGSKELYVSMLQYDIDILNALTGKNIKVEDFLEKDFFKNEFGIKVEYIRVICKNTIFEEGL